MRKVVQGIEGMHYEPHHEWTCNPPPMHTMIVWVLEEIVPQNNKQGGRLRHEKADVPRLTVVAHSNYACDHIMKIIHEQFSSSTPEIGRPPCIKEVITKTSGSSVFENVLSYIATQSSQTYPTRNSETNAVVQDSMTPAAPGRGIINPFYSTAQQTPATEDTNSVTSDGGRGEGIVISQSQN